MSNQHEHGHVHGEDCKHHHQRIVIQPVAAELSAAAAASSSACALPDETMLPAAPVDLLVIAVKASNLEMCQSVVEQHPTSVHECDSQDGATAAHWAALMGNLSILRYLADAGAPLDARVRDSGMAPIHWACTRGNTEVRRKHPSQACCIHTDQEKYKSGVGPKMLAFLADYDCSAAFSARCTCSWHWHERVLWNFSFHRLHVHASFLLEAMHA
eukprot:3833064-Pleurochrysis_carterae.AAC.3